MDRITAVTFLIRLTDTGVEQRSNRRDCSFDVDRNSKKLTT